MRMALGASRASVLQLVLGQGLRLVVLGLVLGGIAALALSNTVRALLFDTEPTDIPTFVGVAALLAHRGPAGLPAARAPGLVGRSAGGAERELTVVVCWRRVRSQRIHKRRNEGERRRTKAVHAACCLRAGRGRRRGGAELAERKHTSVL